MKALTICQPYAHLIVTPEDELMAWSWSVKRCENRMWGTDYRGELAIHAGTARSWLLSYRDAYERRESLTFGAIVGVAELAQCLPVETVIGLAQACPDSMIGEWSALRHLTSVHSLGPFCWLLSNVRRIEPVPCRGAQRLWNVPVDVERVVRDRLIPKCGSCLKCLDGVTIAGIPFAMCRMVFCSVCGNKRCPHATDCRLPCTGSNEPGQDGSVYKRIGGASSRE